MSKHDEIAEAVHAVGRRFDGFGGNCARFAAVLNRVLGGEGTYVIVDGGHYEYVDHVLLDFGGRLYDASGGVTRQQLHEQWCNDGEIVEDFSDESEDGQAVRRLVDDCGPMAAAWSDDDLERAFRRAFAGIGLQLHAEHPRPG